MQPTNPKQRDNILITGASSGIGSALAKLYVAEGKRLALCARRLDQLQELKAEILATNPEAMVLIKALDVNNHDQVFQVFNQFRDELGSLDRVIVNAGIGHGSPIGTGDMASNMRTAMTNFVAALAQCEAALEIIRQQGYGHLVNISSVSAVMTLKKQMNIYAATKAALFSMSKGLSMEFLNSPINVTAILPGYILTDINASIKNAPFRIDIEKGSRLIHRAIEKEGITAIVPAWPWVPFNGLIRCLPLSIVNKML